MLTWPARRWRRLCDGKHLNAIQHLRESRRTTTQGEDYKNVSKMETVLGILIIHESHVKVLVVGQIGDVPRPGI